MKRSKPTGSSARGSWERRLPAGTAGEPLVSVAARLAALPGGSRLAKATALRLARFPQTLSACVFVAVQVILCLTFAATQAAAQAESATGSGAGRTVFGTGLEPLGFNPLRGLDSASYSAQTLVYEGLIKYDKNINFAPALAKSFSSSPDGLTYTFELRDNLHFCDGTPLTIDDVVASISLVQSSLSPFKSDFACIERMEKRTPQVLVLHLNIPSAPLLARLVDMRILPARIISAKDGGNSVLSVHPIGSGPFMLARWEAGLELDFRPNPYYWNGPPACKQLVWRVVPDKSLLAVAMERAEIDVAAIDALTWRFMGGEQTGRTHHLILDKLQGARTLYFGFNLHRKPFDEPAVRAAITQSINREQIVHRLYSDMASIPLTDFTPGSWAYNAALTPTKFDQARARQTLLDNGYREVDKCWRKNGKQLALRIVTVRDTQDIAQIVADDLLRMHISCEVQVMEYSALRSRFLRSGDFDAVLWSRSCGPDPECTLVWKTNGPMNFSGFSNAKADSLIDAGKAATTREARIPIYRELQSILAQEQPWVFLVQPNLLLLHSDKITNLSEGHQSRTGFPWDNPVFNAASWRRAQ